jgi:formate dehydrogenase major subunit
MTNHWVDLQNCKTILVEGSNVAENHPMAFKWIRKAQENGAKIIHVDPRYTRTSSAADMYARIRPGTDAALQNTMINYIIVNKLYDEDYVVTHTNALFLGDEAFDFKDGVFSGYDAEHHKYDTKTWGYQLDGKGKPRVPKASTIRTACYTSQDVCLALHARNGRADHRDSGRSDQADRRHDGEQSAGFHPLRARHDAAHDRRAGHPVVHDPATPVGQYRKPGGGVNALRGEPNVQGACDMAVLYNYMPGISTRRRTPSRPFATTCARTDRRQPVSGQHAQGVLRRRGDR